MIVNTSRRRIAAKRSTSTPRRAVELHDVGRLVALVALGLVRAFLARQVPAVDREPLREVARAVGRVARVLAREALVEAPVVPCAGSERDVLLRAAQILHAVKGA